MMKKILKSSLIFGLLALYCANLCAQADVPTQNSRPSKAGKNMQQMFIDRFVIPNAARKEFLQRMKINRDFIKTLPGFIEDAAYEQIGVEGDFSIVTVAVWKDAAAIENAKRAVFEMYQKQKFDMPAFLKRNKFPRSKLTRF